MGNRISETNGILRWPAIHVETSLQKCTYKFTHADISIAFDKSKTHIEKTAECNAISFKKENESSNNKLTGLNNTQRPN
jgi:hypothetical protein